VDNGQAVSSPAGSKPIVPVICATRDFQGAVAESVVTIWNALWLINREPIYVQFAAHGYAFVRAGVFKGLKQQFGTDLLRGIMLDDDILIKDQRALIKAILQADQEGWNFVSPYRVRDGYTSLANADGSLLRIEETKALKRWDRIPNAGLGFYYGDLPLDYQFHEDGVFGGEDLNFFYDNPQLDIRVVDLELKHLKVVDLGLDTVMNTSPRPKPLIETPRVIPTPAPRFEGKLSLTEIVRTSDDMPKTTVQDAGLKALMSQVNKDRKEGRL
jgi:hypothetical protein